MITHVKHIATAIVAVLTCMLLCSCQASSESSYPLYDVRNIETEEDIYEDVQLPGEFKEFICLPILGEMFGSEVPFSGTLKVSRMEEELYRVAFDLSAEDPQAAVESLKEYIRTLDRLGIQTECTTINEAEGMANLTLEVTMT